METLSIIFMLVTFVLLLVPAVFINNRAVSFLVLVGILMFFFSSKINFDINKGKPTSLNVLTIGEKYEVVAMYEEYIVVKSLTNEKQERLRFIGPLDFDATSIGVGDICIKTAGGSLEKFLRH